MLVTKLSAVQPRQCPALRCCGGGSLLGFATSPRSSVLVASTSLETPSSIQQPEPFQALKQQISKNMSMASVLPFASTGLADGSMTEVYGALSKALDIYLVLLSVRVLLTWFRNINWGSEPFNTIRQFTDPYLNVFRGIIPAIGGIDLSPMLGFFILSFAAKQLKRMSYGF
ncbi:hypothetical protein CEUSTIGMA_g7421.t1 [Chlamydomonas eustigma]|uniref:YggT family protein n=1 Tax=Chlamydomonas eustigma TaxID=1157962 RepID=A0A250XAT6_9CHLO|nr:hypothetical protein CEUSTIGMA_g7421.t1 [Chlamydomonas eustigma]|eukprot:GAX79982.1 hypothetical protein CEUSTIGMA_g7421.t1 [Chlamydomonas eustigma]